MPPDRPRAEDLFHRALELEPEARPAFVAGACGPDTALRQRVEILLAAHERAGSAQAGVEGEEPLTLIDTTPVTEEAGTLVGRYKLLEKLGEGGFGVVWAAEQKEPVRRRVALKIIKLGMDTRQVVARFEAERQALALMDHPNIARVLDAGATDTGRPYFVMELVRGIPMTAYCDQEKLPTHQRLGLFVKVCRAIQHAHQKGVIHRDIKPSNILVTLHDGVPVPKVIDFGIAKATQAELTEKTVYTQFQQFIGTPAYMSPEQAEMSGLDIDTRSDIYSLGVLLYELLTGRTPFDQKELMAAGLDGMRRIIREQEPLRPSTRIATLQDPQRTTTAQRRGSDPAKLISLLGGDLDWIVMKCLEKDRTRRYEAANVLAMDIERHLGHEPVLARPPSAAYRLQKAIQRNRVAFAAATTLAIVVVLGAAISTWQAIQATRAKREQTRLREAADQARASEAIQRRQAERTREEAVTHAQIARQNLYAADMSLAQLALQANNLGRARRLLDRHRPKTTEPDLRGWEWRYLWNQCRSRAIATLTRHSQRALWTSFSPDTRRLAVGYGDGRLEVWDVPSRKRAWLLQTNGPAGPIRFAPGSDLLAQAGIRDGLKLYDLAKGGQSATLSLGRGFLLGFSFSRDGSALACFTSGSGLALVDVARREVIGNHLPAGFVAHQPAGNTWFSPSGERTFVNLGRRDSGPAGDLSVGVFRSRDGVLEHEFVVGNDQRLSAIDLSPDGRFLATGTGYEHSTIGIWDTATFKPVARLDAHAAWIPHLAFSADGRSLASASGDQTVRLWDTETWQERAVLRGHGHEVWAVAFSPDGNLIASGAKDGEVLLWSATAAPSGDARFAFPSHIHTAALLPGEPGIVTLSTNGTCSVWTLPALTETQLPFAPNSFQFFWEPNYLGSYDETNRFRLYAVQLTGARSVGEFLIGGVATRIRYLAGEGALEWRDASGQAQRIEIARDSSMTKPARVHNVSPDGRLRALPGESGVATLYDLVANRPIMALRGHLLAVDGVAFTPDGKRLATTSGGREAAKLWDPATGQELLTLPGHGMNLYSAAFSEDGNVLLVGWRGAGFWQLWRAPSWAEIEESERTGGGWPRTVDP